MKYPSHLCLDKVVLRPTVEWALPASGWSFVRVTGGQGYWFSAAVVRELNAGDVFVAAPGGTSVVRASRIGELQLDLFRFCPELMGGVLTLAERQALERLGQKPGNGAWFYPAAHAMAARFEEVHPPHSGNGFVLRCQLLQVAMDFIAAEVKRPATKEVAVVSAGERFKEVVEHLTEAEVGSLSASELAARCGCSVRHFGRLFARRFGCSFRSRQMRVRMARVRQMLLETDMKVRDVARANGYHHLGLFNSYFRKEFGMTPTECRRREEKNPSGSELAACC